MNSLQLSFQHPLLSSNGQVMNTQSRDLQENVLARLVGWDSDGGGKIEILSDVMGLKVGERYTARVRTVSIGVQPGDFDSLKKFGLRTGGIVLLRKVVKEDDGSLSSRTVETIIRRESDGYPTLLNDAAVCILPPAPGTQVVTHTYVAIGIETSKTKAVLSHLTKIRSSLERACEFGFAGILLTGEDSNGDVNETMIGGDIQRTAAEVEALFKEKVPAAMIKSAKASKTGWRMVPFFLVEIDPDRASKLSAQRMNIDYGSGDELSWTKSDVVLRALMNSWLLCDASTGHDVVVQKSGLLLDVLEE